MEGLEKPELKRSSPIAIPKTPNELDVSVREVSGGRLQGNYTIVSPTTSVAYDVGGNAIVCNREEIMEKKLTPKPRVQVEKEMIWTDDHLRNRRSGLTYDA